MPENERSIKVVDRRLFTADGELTDEAKAELAAPDPVPAPPPAGAQAPGQDSAAASAGTPETAPSAAQPPDSAVTSPAFLALLDMLAQTAGMYLQGIPDPATGRRSIDMAAARQIVDAMVALREKTRGRLSFEESDALEGLVGELQLVFTRLAAQAQRGKGPSIPPPPTGRRG